MVTCANFDPGDENYREILDNLPNGRTLELIETNKKLPTNIQSNSLGEKLYKPELRQKFLYL